MSSIYHKAAKDGLLEVLRHINKRDANKRDEDGMTPVHWAASCGNIECLRVLCSKGGDPDKPCYDGSTSVHVAAACGQFHCLVFLTKFGANIWSLDNQYHTPLEEAAARGQLDCVQYLDRVVAEQMLHHRGRANKQKKESEKMARKRIKKYERSQKKRDKDYQKRVKKQNGVIKDGSKENLPVNHDKKNDGKMRRAQSLDHFSQLTDAKSGTIRSITTLGSTQGSVRQTFLKNGRRTSFSGSVGKSRSLTSLDSAILQTKSSKSKQARDSNDKYIVKTRDHRGNSFTSIESMKKYDSLSSYASTQPSSSRWSWASTRSMDSDVDTDIGEDDDDDVEVSDPRMSSLMTFLASLNLEQFTTTMRKESIDMNALALCTDNDLKSAGIPLGPRRKILEAVEHRNKVCEEPGALVDTHL